MNILPATIKSIISSEQLCCVIVEIQNDEFHLLLAQKLDNTVLGTKVELAFKETEVILSNTISNSSANFANASIQNIEKGPIVTQVTLSYGQFRVQTIISTLSFERLHVSVDDTLTWMLQPSEISLLWSTTDGI